jgi:ADP-ribose pyrophosphatase
VSRLQPSQAASTSGPHTVFRTEWFSIEQLPPAGTGPADKPYYRINAPNGVLVVALTADARIILVRQFRPALGCHTLEIPAGSVDPGESPLDAAARELLEESGFVCATLRLLGEGQVMASRLNSRQYAVLGTGARLQGTYVPQEDIEVRLATPEELKGLALAGEFRQYAAFAPLTLAGWKTGISLLPADQDPRQP